VIRILIADDEELLRSGFRMVLQGQPDFEFVGEAATGAEAVQKSRSLRPHVVLMDIRMPVMSGLDATRTILAEPEHPKVIMLTTFDLDEYIYEALAAGASGFLLKSVSPAELADAIRVVATGSAVLQPQVTTKLVHAFVSRRVAPVMQRSDAALADLTEREREVLRLMGAARSNAEIARELHISENTAKTHVARILMKLDLRDRAQAVVAAYEAGLVTPGG